MAKKSFLLFLSCAIVLAISPSLYAQQKPAAQPEYNNYLVVKGGIFYPRVTSMTSKWLQRGTRVRVPVSQECCGRIR